MSKKTVVDNGAWVSFPSAPPFIEIEPGIYYPAHDHNGHIILIKNKILDKYKQEGKPHDISSTQQFISSNIPDLPLSSSNPAKLLDRVRDNQMETEVQLEHQIREKQLPSADKEESFISSKYFPMQEYNPGLKKVDKGIEFFLERKDFFDDNNLDYKRSILFFGPPGTGKTWYIHNVCEKLVENKEAVIIRIDTYEHLSDLHNGLNDISKALDNRLKVIVIEELAIFCKKPDMESRLLQLLDSTYFRNDVLFLVTTNEPESIPENLIDRPSRLDVLAKIDGLENRDGFIDDWYTHITGKTLPEGIKEEDWYKEAKKSLSPVYWLELFKFSELHQQSLGSSWAEIKERKQVIKNNFSSDQSVGF